MIIDSGINGILTVVYLQFGLGMLEAYLALSSLIAAVAF